MNKMVILPWKILLSILVIKINAEDVVSDEKVERNGNTEKNTYNAAERRFFDNLDDGTWHISHLKDTDFSDNARKTNCKEDTFEEKVKKYRKSLQNDGALVEYVSADALPFDEKDLIDVCQAPEKKDVFKIAVPKKKSTADISQQAQNKSEALKVESEKTKDVKDEPEKINLATTTAEKVMSKPDKPPSVRRSEYQFSSVEYYDEVFDFDPASICPDAVEEIVLNIDHIRSYDVQCEQILEWRSLE